MLKAGQIAIGVTILLLVTFANPLVGNILGFCPPSEGAKAVSIDVLVAAIDGGALWLIFRGLFH